MSHLHRFWKIVILILFIGFMIQCLFDPLATYKNQKKLGELQTELNKQKGKWDMQDITNYSFEVETFVAVRGFCRAKITVHTERVVKVAVYNYPPFEERPADLLPDVLEIDEWDGDCGYWHITVSQIFDALQDSLNDKIKVDAEFDPEFGFVTRYYGSSNVSYGRLNCCVADSEFSYRFYNFQILGPPAP